MVEYRDGKSGVVELPGSTEKRKGIQKQKNAAEEGSGLSLDCSARLVSDV